MSKKVCIVGGIRNHYRFYLTIAEIFRTEKVILNCTKEVRNEILQTNITTNISYEIYDIMNLYHEFSIGEINIIEQPYMLNCLFQLAKRRNIPNKYVICHNANTWFFPWSNIYKSFKIKNIRSIILREIIKKRITNYILVSNTIEDYLRNKIKNKHFISIPFDLIYNTNLAIDEPNSNQLKIVIPGTISKARDYELITETIVSLDASKDKFMFIFLGTNIGTYGDIVYKKLSDLRDEGFSIKLYDSFVDPIEFDYQLRNCHIILSAFNITFYTDDGFIEKYGISKETGVPFIALNYGKKVFLPKSYNQPHLITNQTLSFNNKDELKILLKTAELNKDEILESKSDCHNRWQEIETIKINIFNKFINKQ